MDRKVETWTKEDEKFVETRLSKSLKNKLGNCGFIVVIGNPGTGKSSLVRHLALHLNKTDNYDIMTIHSPAKIVDYTNPAIKQVFVIDDVCGKCSLSSDLIEAWKRYEEDITNILGVSQVRIIVTSRTDIFRCPRFQRVTILKSNVYDLCSPEFSLIEDERNKIARIYLNEEETSVVLNQSLSTLYEFFPLLCKIYSENKDQDIKTFFTRPVKTIEERLSNMQVEDDKTSFCSLTLLVLFNDTIEDVWLTNTISDKNRELLQFLYEECEMSTLPSRKTIKRELDKLTGAFVKLEEGCYKSLHDKIFDIIAGFVGRELFDFILLNADYNFISERYVFHGTNDAEEYLIRVPINKEEHFFNRLFENCSKAFKTRQLEHTSFREKLIYYCYNNEKSVKAKLCQIDQDSEPTPLVHSVTSGYDDIVAMLLKLDVNVNVSDEIGRTAVAIAVEMDHPQILSMLLAAKGDANTADKHGYTPLCVAAGFNREQCCKMLLEHGALPDKCSTEGMFPLYLACMNDHRSIVELLLRNNAKVNLYNTYRWTTLHVACRRNNSEIVKILLEANADPNINPNNLGISPLFEAVSIGNLEIVQLLLKCGATFKDMLNGKYCLNEAVERKHIEIAKYLLEKGAEPNTHDADDKFPLLCSASSGDFKLTELLVEYGGNVNDCSKGLHTPLSVACYLGRSVIVEYLLNNKADVTFTNLNGETALHISARSKNSKVSQLLLMHQADPNICNFQGKSSVSEAAFYNNTDSLRLFLENGGYSNTQNNAGETPLLVSARAGNIEAVSLLLQYNAEPDIPDNAGNTPLSEASGYGFIDIVMLLLANDASVNVINIEGSGPLHQAAAAGWNDIVTVLLNRGADSSLYNNAGLTAKDIAILCGYQDVYGTLEYDENLPHST